MKKFHVARYTSDQVAWATFLGANTPQRLAREWKLTYKQASNFFKRAVENGFVVAATAQGSYRIADKVCQ